MATSGAELSDIFGADGHPLSWQVNAACSGLDTNLFHSTSKSNIEYCKLICAKCPVAKQCLEYALDFDREFSFDKQLGVYGGMTSEERRLYWDRLRRSKQRSRATKYERLA